MKVGSLVVAIDDFYNSNVWYISKGTILEIRTIEEGIIIGENTPSIGLRFVWIVNGLAPNGQEYLYCIDHFREIQPPMEINIEELLTEPQTADV